MVFLELQEIVLILFEALFLIEFELNYYSKQSARGIVLFQWPRFR